MNIELIKKEVAYKAVRSSKPGGQHVNKVSSKIQLFFDILKSQAFSDQQKQHLQNKLGNRLINTSVIIISADNSRSQFQNKKVAFDRLVFILNKALQPTKKRLKTKPKKSAVLKRLKRKKRHSEKKNRRKKDFL